MAFSNDEWIMIGCGEREITLSYLEEREKERLAGFQNKEKTRCPIANRRLPFDQTISHRLLDSGWIRVLVQLIDLLDYGYFGSRRVVTTESAPVVYHQTAGDHVRSTIHGASDQRQLQKCGQFVHLLDVCARMYDAS